MQTSSPLREVRIKWIMIFVIMSACVERIEFDVPVPQLLTVVEGLISDAPGPYTVKISTSISLDADSVFRPPVEHATVKLYDDEGHVEDFTEASPGIYITGGSIRGRVGHSYHIVIETEDGIIFESEPERINPVGDIETIRYEFEPRTIQEEFGEVVKDVFNIYIDSHASSGDESFTRWRFTGTYKVLTYPEFHETWNPPYTPYKDPLPCSGFIVVGGPIGSGGLLEQVGDCTCCTCWANHHESAPQLSDTQLVSDNQFNNVKVGEVPINNATFHEKYMVQVEQMSLSRKVFEFFKLIRAQKEGASSLFQPPSGEIRGNIIAENSRGPVVGIFWATSIKKKTLFIYPSDVPYPLTPIDFVAAACTFYPNSSTEKPENWE